MPTEFLKGTKEISIPEAALPPLVYFLALVLLPPFFGINQNLKKAIPSIRTVLALTASALFASLPLRYRVDHSAGLTYILALIGWYGATRIIDTFFLTDHIPRRVQRKLKLVPDVDHAALNDDASLSSPSTPFLTDDESAPPPLLSPQQRIEASKLSVQSDWSQSLDFRNESPSPQPEQQQEAKNRSTPRNPFGLLEEAAFSLIGGSRPRRGSLHIQKSREEPHATLTWPRRLLWALDLELSMRGVGWCWTTADVRHTRKTWLPTVADELEQVLCVDVPNVTGAWFLTRLMFKMMDPAVGIDSLPYWARGLLTLAQGFFLFGTFALGYHCAALATFVCGLRNPYRTYSSNNLAYFPPLNSRPLYEATSVRAFWSRSWHRLFSRFFLVWGVWPGQWLQQHIVPAAINRRLDPHHDVGKVLGAFFSSGVIHSAASITINGGNILKTGEFIFFFTNGVAVVVEEAFLRVYRRYVQCDEVRWYERAVSQLWTVTVMLTSGQYFTRGWVDSGLIEEMSLTSITLKPFQHLKLKAGIDVSQYLPSPPS